MQSFHRLFASVLVVSLILVTPTFAQDLAAPAAAQAAPGAVTLTPQEIEITEDITYGTGAGEALTLHLARPKNLTAPAPCIVYIHGGGWMMGNKNMHKPAIRAAAARGYVSATVGYRFAPKHRFPAQIEDCKCAIRYLRAHASELNIDPQRIGAIGYSAGAHLSMMLGVRDAADGLEGEGGWADQSSKVQAVVSYFGPTNLTNTDISSTPAGKYLNESAIRRILEAFVGGKPEEHLDLLRRASPLTYVNAGDAPMLLFQGTRDDLVPYDQAFQMVTALTDVGVPGRLEVLLQKGHGWFGDDQKRTDDASLEFFQQCFSPKKTRRAKNSATGC